MKIITLFLLLLCTYSVLYGQAVSIKMVCYENQVADTTQKDYYLQLTYLNTTKDTLVTNISTWICKNISSIQENQQNCNKGVVNYLFFLQDTTQTVDIKWRENMNYLASTVYHHSFLAIAPQQETTIYIPFKNGTIKNKNTMKVVFFYVIMPLQELRKSLLLKLYTYQELLQCTNSLLLPAIQLDVKREQFSFIKWNKKFYDKYGKIHSYDLYNLYELYQKKEVIIQPISVEIISK